MATHGGKRVGAGRPCIGNRKRETISGSIDHTSVAILRSIMANKGIGQGRALDLVIQAYKKLH